MQHSSAHIDVLCIASRCQLTRGVLLVVVQQFFLTLKLLPLSLSIGIEFQITLTINQLIFKVIELFISVLRETLQESLRGADGTVREEPADVGLATKSRLLLSGTQML